MTEDAIRKTLQNLPKDLHQTYARIVRKIYEGPGGQSKIEQVKKVLRWVSCARRPLRLEELEEAIGLDKTDTFLHVERTAANAGRKLIGNCGNLVVYDREADAVTLAHPTIRQFLCSQTDLPPDSYPSSVHFEIQAADSLIGEICIAYLSFSDFETQLTKVVMPPVLERKEAEQLIWSQVPLRSFIRTLTSWSYRDSNQAVVKRQPHATYAFPVPEQPSPTLATKYLILPYIIDYWAIHASNFTEETACWAAFEHVVFERQLQFEYRPCMQYPHTNAKNVLTVYVFVGNAEPRLLQISTYDEKCNIWMPIYSWALEHRIKSLFRLLLSRNDIRTSLLQYHQRYPAIEKLGRKFFDMLLDSPRQVCTQPPSTYFGNSFLNADFIYHVARSEYDTYLLHGINPEHARDTLRWLRDQLHKHSLADPTPHINTIFEGAISIALEKSRSDGFSSFELLCNVHLNDGGELSRVLTVLVEKGYMSTGNLCIVLSSSKEVAMPERLRTAELTAILDKFLSSICFQARLVVGYVPEIPSIHPSYAWLLLERLLESNISCPELVELLLDNKHEVTVTRSFPRKALGVSSTTRDRATTMFSQLLLPISAPNGGQDYEEERRSERILTLFLQHPFMNQFDPKALENRGEHCLLWATQWNMSSVVEALMPSYSAFILDNVNIVELQEILRTAIRTNMACLTHMLEYEWNHTAVTIAILTEQPKIRDLDSLLQERLRSMADDKAISMRKLSKIPEYLKENALDW